MRVLGSAKLVPERLFACQTISSQGGGTWVRKDDDGGSWLKIGWNWKQRWKKSVRKLWSWNSQLFPKLLEELNPGHWIGNNSFKFFNLLVIIHRVIGGNWAISPIFFQWLVADHFLAQPRPLHRVKIEALSTRRDPKTWPKWLWVKTLGDPTRSIVGQRMCLPPSLVMDGFWRIQGIQGTLWR